MARQPDVKSIDGLLRMHNIVLVGLKKRFSNCSSEDIKILIKRDIVELEQKIERIKNNEQS